MDATYVVCGMCLGLVLAGCQRSQRAHGAAASSGREATLGEAACAHEPGVPPEVGEGEVHGAEQPCRSSHSVMGEDAQRPDER